MSGRECVCHLRERGEWNAKCGVAALVAEMNLSFDTDIFAALRGDIERSKPTEIAGQISQRFNLPFVEGLPNRLLPNAAQRGELHAIGRKQSRQRVDEHRCHAERIADEAGVLSTGAAEAVQHIAPGVVALGDGNFLDRISHVLDRDPNKEAVGGGFGAASVTDFARHRLERGAHCISIERLIGARPKNCRKELGPELAEHHICFCHGERPSAAIGHWPRHRTGGIRPGAEARAVEMQDRSAAGRDGVDRHHRHTQANTGDFGFVDALVIAIEPRDIGRCAAHVETDDVVETFGTRGLRHSDHAAGRTRQDRVLAAKELWRGESAVGGHEEKPRPRAQRILDARGVAPQHRREIGVGDRRIAARNEFRQRCGFVAGGDLREARFARDLGGTSLMRRIAVAMHKQDRAGSNSLGVCLFQIAAQFLFVGSLKDFAFGRNAFVYFDHARIEHIGQLDLQREQLGAILVADPELIGKAPRRDQYGWFALALQQGVGRYRRA